MHSYFHLQYSHELFSMFFVWKIFQYFLSDIIPVGTRTRIRG